MPCYDVKCESCGAEYEILKRMSEDLPPCKECGGELKQLVAGFDFCLKGSTWEKDGYVNKI